MINDPLLQNLADQIGFSTLYPGEVQVQSDEREKPTTRYIEYCWLLKELISMRGAYWLFSVKTFWPSDLGKESHEALTQGFFAADEEAGMVYNLRTVERTENLSDPIRTFKQYDLFDTGAGLVLDGVFFDFYILAHRANITMRLHQPASNSWERWIDTVIQFRQDLINDDELDAWMGVPR